MNKFSNSSAFNSFVPINNTNRFTATLSTPIRRTNSLSVQELVSHFEKKQSVENELADVKPNNIDNPIKEEAKKELLKEEDVVEPVLELVKIYPKENDINIERAIQKEIEQGYKEPRLKLIVDEIVLNMRKKKSKSGWTN